jgi:hypothetical protein
MTDKPFTTYTIHHTPDFEVGIMRQVIKGKHLMYTELTGLVWKRFGPLF